MQLFDTKGADEAYSRWQEPKNVHEEDGCERCHAIHVEEWIFQEGCKRCDEIKCLACNGASWVYDPDPENLTHEMECPQCDSGRIC